MNILIIGSVSDEHINIVSRKLESNNCSVRNLFHDCSQTTFSVINTNEDIFLCEDMEFFTPSVIWDRAKLFPLIRNINEIELSNYISNTEWIELYQDIYYSFKDKIINNYFSKIRCNRKINQQIVASRIGMKTPETIITTSRSDAIKFMNQHGDCVIKPIGFPLQPNPASIKENRVILSQIMTSSIVVEVIDNISDIEFRKTPSMTQRMVNNRYELRVFSTKCDTLPFQINSNEKDYTKVDWRWGVGTLEFKEVHADRKLMAFCTDFLSAMNLEYGVFDIAVDEEDNYWFFECNPDGQWLWLDEIANGKISDCLAKTLLQKSGEICC